MPADVPAADLAPDVLLLPGLVDLHCDGGAGGEFGPDEEAARRAAEHHHRSGSTTVVASLVSARPARLVDGVRICARLAADGIVAGVHTEGPFLSPSRCGAQDPAALTGVDLDLVESLAEADAGHWRAMTFAPELDGTPALVERLVDAGVLPSVGHTDADAASTAAALAHAAELLGDRRRASVTHLFNAMPPLHHREPGAVAASLSAAARGQAVVELIADGVHLADATVSMVLDLLGPDAVVLVSDAMAASGMPEGRYRIGNLDAVVAGGTVRLTESGAIAGSTGTLLDVVRRCVQNAGTALVDAVRSASATPWRPACGRTSSQWTPPCTRSRSGERVSGSLGRPAHGPGRHGESAGGRPHHARSVSMSRRTWSAGTGRGRVRRTGRSARSCSTSTSVCLPVIAFRPRRRSPAPQPSSW